MPGFGDGFMDFSRGFNRWVTGMYHEGKGGAKYYWNGGSNPSVDSDDCQRGRLEGAAEYMEGEQWSRSGHGLIRRGVQGMGSAIWDGITGGDNVGPACWADGTTDAVEGETYDAGTSYDGEDYGAEDMYEGMY